MKFISRIAMSGILTSALCVVTGLAHAATGNFVWQGYIYQGQLIGESSLGTSEDGGIFNSTTYKGTLAPDETITGSIITQYSVCASPVTFAPNSGDGSGTDHEYNVIGTLVPKATGADSLAVQHSAAAAYLVSNYLNLYATEVNPADDGSVLQHAVWDLLNVHTYTGSDSRVGTLESIGLSNINSNRNDVMLLTPGDPLVLGGTFQNQLVALPAVPEPGVLQLGAVVSITGIGFLRLRRKK